jgi:hypothetical protein
MNLQQTRTKTKLYNLGSYGAILNNGTKKSNVSINLPLLGNSYDENIQNIYFSVLHCEVPNSFYVINSTNNTIIINSSTYSITNGNYNALTLATVLTSTTGFTFSYNSIKLIYTVSGVSIFTISKNSTIAKVIGMNTTQDITSVGNQIVMPYIVNFLPLPRINFRCPQLNFSNYNSSDNAGDCFLSIQNSASIGSMNLYYNLTSLKYVMDFSNPIQQINLRITDDYNNLLDFNNIDWYITFQFDIEYIPTPKDNNSFSRIVGGF